MNGRVVTAQEAPELHGVVDRLCALADVPRPAVAIADSDVPNAFATGRTPRSAVVCATTGILAPAGPLRSSKGSWHTSCPMWHTARWP